jgi:hypothetical protein
MEKRNDWNVGDILIDRYGEFWKVVSVEVGAYGLTFIHSKNLIKDIISRDSLLYIDNTFKNLSRDGNGAKILYGTKSKNNTN